MDSYSAPDDVNKESQETHNDISFLSVEFVLSVIFLKQFKSMLEIRYDLSRVKT